MLYMAGYSIKEVVNHEFWSPHILKTRGKEGVIMKFENKLFGEYEYLIIRDKNDKKLPFMVNLTLASKDDIISFLEWLEKKMK